MKKLLQIILAWLAISILVFAQQPWHPVDTAKPDLSNLANPTNINVPTLQFAGAAGIESGGTNNDINLIPSGSASVVIGSTNSAAQILFNNTNPTARFGNFGTRQNSVFGFSVPGNAIVSFDGVTFNTNFEGSVIINGGNKTLGPINPNFAADVRGSVGADTYHTQTNCASSASPAVCGSAAAGRFVIAAGATTATVNTTAVTANSEILITEDQSLGVALGVTCNTSISSPPVVSSRVAGTSFSVIISSALATNPVCYDYSIIN